MTRGLDQARPRPATARRPQRTGQDGASSVASSTAPQAAPAAGGRQRDRAPDQAQAGAKGLPGLAVLFLVSLLWQTSFQIGPLMMKPYRFVLLGLFIPLLAWLLSGRAGKVLVSDWLIIGAALWAMLALMVNHPFAMVVEPSGVVFLEFLGAYLLARVCIRSAEDFRGVVKVLSVIVLVLLFFAVLESLTHRPILMQLVEPRLVSNQAPRWGLRRVQAVFVHPIHYGIFVSAGLGMIWYALRPDAGFVRRAIGAVLIGLATFLSLSTSALIAFVMQCAFIGWELVTRPNPRRWRIFAWGALAGYVLLDFLSNRTPFHVLVDYASFSSGSAYNRILIWRHGTDNVAASPIFGIGLNDWVKPGWMSDSVDNFWLLLTMQYGLPFIIMFAGALLLILRRVSRQALTDPVDRACRAGYLTTFGGIVIAGGTVHYWQTMFAFVLFLFGAGVWLISGGAKPAPSAAEPAPAPPDARAGPARRSRQRSVL